MKNAKKRKRVRFLRFLGVAGIVMNLI